MIVLGYTFGNIIAYVDRGLHDSLDSHLKAGGIQSLMNVEEFYLTSREKDIAVTMHSMIELCDVTCIKIRLLSEIDENTSLLGCSDKYTKKQWIGLIERKELMRPRKGKYKIEL